MSTVYIRRDTDDRAGFAQAFLELPEVAARLERATSVLVKPNVVSAEAPPETTHPDVLRATLRRLSDLGKRFTVGDGPPPFIFNRGKTPRSVVRSQPLQEVCAEHGLELLNLHDHGFDQVATPSGFRLPVSRVAREHDLLLSLPVAKAHNICQLTGALKNQFGLLPNGRRILYHAPGVFQDLHRVIAEVNQLFPDAVYLVDAVCSYRRAQMRILGGVPCHPRTMLGGLDPVALDSAVLDVLRQFEPKLSSVSPGQVKHVGWAARLGRGQLEAELSML